MITDLQLRALLAEAQREERITRAAAVVSADAHNRVAIEVADLVTKPEVLPLDLEHRYLAARAQARQAQRKWRLARQALEVAEARRAS